ncbi:MAG TPA: hypothetical protein VMV00_01445 [Candidatus Baltobacteraceae bacterium]|nr:hypothetical protein [Candidatus Baltobacteraceae bacterium]
MIPLSMPALVTLPGLGLLPLVAIALALDGAIVGIWYITGFVLNNNTVRGSAKEEFYQLIGTAVMMGIIIGALVIFSGLFYSSLGATKLMNPAAMSLMCANIQNGHSIDLLSGSTSVLAPSTKPGGFPGLCNLVSKKAAPSITDQIDYPLAATSVIIANVTNQTIGNLDSTFVYDSFIGFFSQLTPTVTFCVPSEEGFNNACVNPIRSQPAAGTVTYSAQPQEGFDLLFTNMITYGTLLGGATEALLGQLMMSVLFLYIWPTLLFAGIILRAVFYTRKIGGLLIAISIGFVMFFPAVYAFEYLAMGNGVPASTSQVYGFSPDTGIPNNAIPTVNQNYQLNFFVQPNMRRVFLHEGCWPTILGAPVPPAEAYIYDTASLSEPQVTVLSLLEVSSLGTGTLAVPFITSMPATCSEASGLNAFFPIIQSYGITGITAFLLPIINLFIMLTGVLGLSGQLGGDTSLAGLTKLV